MSVETSAERQRRTGRRQQGFEYAGMLDRRAEAAILDALIVHLSLFLLGYVVGTVVVGGLGAGLGLGLFGIVYVSPVGILVYHVVLEGLYGKTIGKHVRNLVVRSDDGSEIGLGASAVRNLLRIVDALPVLYLIGILVSYTSERNQRLGDRAGNTIVVRER